ncbi:unnamed protein product [Symbiodinium necroappetens]|uniref:Uncharacterized protein n=1 Tax=Symbiodinium necroappetens TaxID=1628268 RepID=A0A812NEF4_9DINO|nr:unnamed protein product [Symbiodinium necroappetens]
MEYDGLVKEWDACESIRNRLRGGGFLEDTSLGDEPNNKVCVLNQDVIVPLLVRMVPVNLQLPIVEQLRTVVAKLYEDNQRQVDESRVDDSAWFCRKLVVHVKRKAQKKLVSMDMDFQELCLVLKPELQDLVDGIRAQQAEDDPEDAGDEQVHF